MQTVGVASSPTQVGTDPRAAIVCCWQCLLGSTMHSQTSNIGPGNADAALRIFSYIPNLRDLINGLFAQL